MKKFALTTALSTTLLALLLLCLSTSVNAQTTFSYSNVEASSSTSYTPDVKDNIILDIEGESVTLSKNKRGNYGITRTSAKSGNQYRINLGIYQEGQTLNGVPYFVKKDGTKWIVYITRSGNPSAKQLKDELEEF